MKSRVLKCTRFGLQEKRNQQELTSTRRRGSQAPRLLLGAYPAQPTIQEIKDEGANTNIIHLILIYKVFLFIS